jgi:very-short-patch-repair endonuclease
MNYSISKDLWHTCQICKLSIQELAKKYGGSGIYYTDVFKKHLEFDHNMTELDYFMIYDNQPICKCGICNKPSNICSSRNPFKWREYMCGRFPELLEWSKKAKESRKGSGNPMYQQKPWNKGLDKNSHPSIMSSSVKNQDKKISDESKQKMSIAAKKRKVHGHTGHKHSQKTRERLRESTLSLINKGVFAQLKSKCHLGIRDILLELKLNFEEEKILECWSFDFYVVDYNLYIEADGDYFHSNPRIYPDGPKTKTQKINWYRDIKKNKYVIENNIKLIRFWESDILNNQESIKCKLKELLQLKN